MSVEIKSVTTRKELKAFVQFYYDLYRNSPYAVPYLYSDELKTLTRDKNPAFAFCDTQYFMAYKDGRLCGQGRKYARSYIDVMRADGEEAGRSLFYAGEFKDDKYHGQGKLYNQFCTLEYEGQWEDGWRSGEGTEYYPIGFAKYVGTWKRGRYDGKGVFTLTNRDVIKGEWHNGLLEGHAEFITRDGRVYEREYLHDEIVSERLKSSGK